MKQPWQREQDSGEANHKFYKYNTKKVQVIVALSQPYLTL
jgi:hypothetical protein